jgi:hypothetical protein
MGLLASRESRTSTQGRVGTSPRAVGAAFREGSLPRVLTKALGELNFVFFGFLPHLFKSSNIIWNSLLKFGLILNFLLYFVSFLFCRIFYTLKIWTAGAWNNIIWWFKKWYLLYLVYIEALSKNSHEISSILFTGKVFLYYWKSGQSPEITKLVGASTTWKSGFGNGRRLPLVTGNVPVTDQVLQISQER